MAAQDGTRQMEASHEHLPGNGYALEVPTAADFLAIGTVSARAFAEKRFRCFCLPLEGPDAAAKSTVKAYETYLTHHPQKLAHCRVAREHSSGTILGVCQLQCPGDVGDLRFGPSGSALLHRLKPGEAYIEWIGVLPESSGCGVGSRLLAWADSFAVELGCNCISLEVMTRNRDAIRLYKRKGYLVQHRRESIIDLMFTACFLWCFLGCRYCSLTYMEKPLSR